MNHIFFNMPKIDSKSVCENGIFDSKTQIRRQIWRRFSQMTLIDAKISSIQPKFYHAYACLIKLRVIVYKLDTQSTIFLVFWGHH